MRESPDRGQLNRAERVFLHIRFHFGPFWTYRHRLEIPVGTLNRADSESKNFSLKKAQVMPPETTRPSRRSAFGLAHRTGGLRFTVSATAPPIGHGVVMHRITLVPNWAVTVPIPRTFA